MVNCSLTQGLMLFSSVVIMPYQYHGWKFHLGRFHIFYFHKTFLFCLIVVIMLSSCEIDYVFFCIRTILCDDFEITSVIFMGKINQICRNKKIQTSKFMSVV